MRKLFLLLACLLSLSVRAQENSRFTLDAAYHFLATSVKLLRLEMPLA